MSDDPPVQAFSFRFTNPVQDSGEPLANILFIQETPGDRDLLTVEATPLGAATIRLLRPPTATPGPTNYHFALTFTLGTLARPGSIRLSDDHADEWVMVHRVQGSTRAARGTRAKPTGRTAGRAVGDDVLYFLYKGSSPPTLDADRPLALMMHTIGGAPAGGSRSTVVRFDWSEDPRLVDVQTNRLPPITDRFGYAGLTVLRRRLAATPPLAAGFVTSDTVLNDGASQSFFQLQIVNTSATAIQLSPTTHDTPTRFTLRFFAGSNTAAREVLATPAQINAFKIPGTSSHGADTGWSTSARFDVAHSANNTSWTLTPKQTRTTLEPGEAILLPMSNLVTGHATGRSALILTYQGLPDYDDGELTVYVQKSPLVFADHKVGIGTVAPGDKLTINTAGTAAEPREYGLTQVSGTVKLSTAVHSKKADTGFGRGAIGTQSNHDFYLFTSGQANQRLTIKTDGKIGIGTESPIDKLTISTSSAAYGVTHTNGTLKLSSFLYLSPVATGFGTQSDHDLHLFTNGKDNKRVSVLKGGNVGIGTTAPADKLTISTGTNAYGVTHTSGSIKLSSFLYASATGFGTQSGHDLHLFTSGQTNKRVTIKADGKIGIGTEAPAERVHITGGSLRCDGVIKSDSPIDFYPNIDNVPPDQDLLRVRNSSGTQVFAIKHDGALYFSRKPFEYKIFDTSSDYHTFDTGYPHADWVAVLAGFDARGQNNNRGLKLMPGSSSYNRNWVVVCDTIGGKDDWIGISMLFIRREFVHVHNSWGVQSTRSEAPDDSRPVAMEPFESASRRTRAVAGRSKPRPKRAAARPRKRIRVEA